jgi:hypothetical protein
MFWPDISWPSESFTSGGFIDVDAKHKPARARHMVVN